MSEKKIAYVITRFPTVTETFILRELVELRRLGWEITLFPLIKDKSEVLHDEVASWMESAVFTPFISLAIIRELVRAFIKVPGRFLTVLWRVVRYNLSSPNYLARAMVLFPKAVFLAKLIQDRGLTHIHTHYASHPSLVAWIIREFAGLEYSITVHAHDIFVRKAMLEPKIKAAQFVIAISKFNRDYLARLYGEDVLQKTEVIHCGITPEWYVNGQPTFQNGHERFEILNIGSLRDYKGQSYLIEACAQLKEQGIDFRCRIVGDGEEHDALVEQINAIGVSDRVELLGFLPQDQIAALLKEVHCYVQPSVITPSGKMEGIPVVLMEALASAIPTVATNISGIPELVRPGETGYLVEPANVKDLAEAIKQVWADYDVAKALAQSGRELVLEEFTIADNVVQLSAIFDEKLKN